MAELGKVLLWIIWHVPETAELVPAAPRGPEPRGAPVQERREASELCTGMSYPEKTGIKRRSGDVQRQLSAIVGTHPSGLSAAEERRQPLGDVLWGVAHSRCMQLVRVSRNCVVAFIGALRLNQDCKGKSAQVRARALRSLMPTRPE